MNKCRRLREASAKQLEVYYESISNWKHVSFPLATPCHFRIFEMAGKVLQCLVCFGLIGLALASTPPAASPAAEADLICHTENLAECYPRIFQPTKDFQIIHDDQDIPPGLHVRMDIYSGKKEARLNIPMEGETEMEGLPTERTVVVVPQPDAADSIEDDKPALRDRVPQKPPAYEAAGKVKPPRAPDGASGESQLFLQAVENLNGNYIYDPEYHERVGVALESLQDLSHDIYYGVELMDNSAVLQQLVLHMSHEDPNNSAASLRRHQAAAVIGHSVQNNPTALEKISQSWKKLMAPACGKGSVNSLGLSICETQDLVSKLRQSLAQETDPIVAKSKVYALSGLAKDRELRDAFLAGNGMELLLAIFMKDNAHWEGTKIKIAQFVMDTFLDENMGAQLGIWPQEPEIEGQYCEKAEYATRDGCWEHQLVKMGAGNPKEADEWKKEFLRLLGEARGGKTEPKNEL